MSFETTPHPLSSLQHQALGAAAMLYQPPVMRSTHPADSTLRFGLIADPQYADVDADVHKKSLLPPCAAQATEGDCHF